MFTILYGFVGIPIAGLFLAYASDHFSNSLLRLYERQSKLHNDKHIGIAIAAVIYLLPGLALFLFIPAAIFTVIEVPLVALNDCTTSHNSSNGVA